MAFHCNSPNPNCVAPQLGRRREPGRVPRASELSLNASSRLPGAIVDPRGLELLAGTLILLRQSSHGLFRVLSASPQQNDERTCRAEESPEKIGQIEGALFDNASPPQGGDDVDAAVSRKGSSREGCLDLRQRQREKHQGDRAGNVTRGPDGDQARRRGTRWCPPGR